MTFLRRTAILLSLAIILWWAAAQFDLLRPQYHPVPVIERLLFDQTSPAVFQGQLAPLPFHTPAPTPTPQPTPTPGRHPPTNARRHCRRAVQRTSGRRHPAHAYAYPHSYRHAHALAYRYAYPGSDADTPAYADHHPDSYAPAARRRCGIWRKRSICSN